MNQNKFLVNKFTELGSKFKNIKMIIGAGRKTVTAESNISKPLIKRESGLSPLLMYSDPPSGKIEYEDFTNLALDRFAGKNYF